MVFCVPTLNVLVIDLTYAPEKAAKYDDIKKVVKQASEGPSRASWAILRTRLCPVTLTVTPHSSTFDAGAGIALNDHFI